MRSLRKSLALLLALAMVLSAFAVTTVSAKTFSDSSGHWAETWINKWSDKNVINGYEDGTFRPDNFITRAELAKIISTAKSYTALADIAFTDVAGDEWYAADLKKCVAQGVIGGYEDGTFRPDEFITREEASAMFVRAYNINAIGMLNFADNNDISEWSKTAVTALVGAGVINGYEDGTFLPKATITRAEVVKILDGVDSVVAAFPQATNSTGGTNTVTTIGNLGNSGGSSGGGSGSGQTTPSYKVTFNSNGGKFSDGLTTSSITVGKNGVIGAKAPQPVRDGMLFEGWYTDASAANELIASKKWNINAAVTRNLTLYAGWYIDGKVVVSFETNGGSPAVPSQTIDSGSFAETPNVNLTRAHYTFDGWYTKNVGGSKVDFSSTPIRINTRFYARWSVDADYADKEITIPDVTTGSYQNGTIEALPPSVIPGETVTFTVTPPSGFEVEGIPTITYISNTTGEETTIGSSAIKYNEATGEFSFVMPEDVQEGTLKINPRFIGVLPTAPPTVKPAGPTVDPNVTAPPTEEPKLDPTYYFANNSVGDTWTAGVERDGLTVSADASVESRNKNYSGSDYKYTKALRINKADVTFKVTGSCKIMIDMTTPSSNDRAYEVYAGSIKLGEFTCVSTTVAETATFSYAGSGAETIRIHPLDGLTLHGIFVDYNAEISTPAPATPSPTVDPNTKYLITTDSSAVNGEIVINNGKVSSDNIKVTEWSVDKLTLDESTFATNDNTADITPLFHKNDEIFLNGENSTDGYIIPYADLWWYKYKNTENYMRGVLSADYKNIVPPFTPTSFSSFSYTIYRVYTPYDGQLSLKIYINADKNFYLYDNNDGSEETKEQAHYIVNGDKMPVEGFYDFDIECSAGHSYYFWANGSKVGVKSVNYSNGILNAKAGDTVTITTKPNEGYKVSEIVTEPKVNVVKTGDNIYTFKMPASQVNVNAVFIESSAQEYTVTAPKPEHGTVDLEKVVVSTSADDENIIAQADGDAIDSSSNFLMADGNGGKWITSSDGRIASDDGGATVTQDETNIGGNSTEKLKLMDKAVQYVLEEPINNGDFELSYDFYQTGVADAGRSFRTYLDNAAHAYSESSGKASAMGNENAFFHMTNISNEVYVTNKVSDVGAGAAAGSQVGDKKLESDKWYRAVISGNLDDGTLSVAFYLHGTDGQYAPDNISATPYISSDEVSFTDDRAKQIAQVKFMRTASGTLYYDNIKLSTSADKTLKAYNGETVHVISNPDSGYELGDITVIDTTGNSIQVNNDSFVMPSSDVTVNVTFVLEGTKPTAPPTSDPNKEYTVKVADGITGGTLQIVQPTPEPTSEPTATPMAMPSAAPGTTLYIIGAETSVDEKAAYSDDDNINVRTEYATSLKDGNSGSVSGIDFTYNIQIRIAAESGDYGTEQTGSTPLVISPKKNGTFKIYYRRQSDSGAAHTYTPGGGKDLKLSEKGGFSPLSGTWVLDNEDDAGSYGFGTQSWTVTAGTEYVLWARGTTGTLYAYEFIPEGSTGISAAADEEVLVDSLKAKAGQTITVKAIADNPNGTVTITTEPNVTVKDLGNGYYTFTMPAADTVVNAKFDGSVSPSTPDPSETPVTDVTPNPTATTGTDVTPEPSTTVEPSVEATVIKASQFKSTVGSFTNKTKPRLNSGFAFGTATDAYTKYADIFGANAVDAGTDFINYNGKWSTEGNVYFTFTPEEDGTYSLYLLLKANSNLNNLFAKLDEGSLVGFTASEAVDSNSAVVATANDTFNLTKGTEYKFSITTESGANYTSDFAAAALVPAKSEPEATPTITPGTDVTPGPLETPGPSATAPNTSEETPGPSATAPSTSEETPTPSATPISSVRTSFTDKFLVKDGNADGLYIGTDGSTPGGAEETAEGQLKLTAKNMALYLPEAVDLENNRFELTYDYNINNSAYTGRSFRIYLGNSAIEKDDTTGIENAAFSASVNSVFFHLCDIDSSVYTSSSADTLSAKATGIGVAQVGTGSLTDATWYKVTITADKDGVSVKYVPYSDYINGVLSDNAVIDSTASYVPEAVKSLVSVRFMATAVANELYDNISYTITPNTSTTP